MSSGFVCPLFRVVIFLLLLGVVFHRW